MAKRYEKPIEGSIEGAGLVTDVQGERRMMVNTIVDACFNPPIEGPAKLSFLTAILEEARRSAGWSEAEIVRGR